MKYFAQFVGFAGVAINLLIYQQKSQKRILFFKSISDIVWALHYMLLGAFSGAAVAGVGLMRETVFIFSKKHRKKWLVLFMLITSVSIYFTWKNWYSIFPAIASFLSVISFWQKSPKRTRLFAFPISFCMCSYSLSSGSWAGVCNELLTISSATIGLIRQGGRKMKKTDQKNPFRIGVINWDCAIPEETYFGQQITRSLSPKQFRVCTPYYAHVENDNKISCTYKTQEEFDRELGYAIEAGIDYFAYTWYTEETFERTDVEGKLHEITYARKMHLSSRLKDQIKLCAIIVCPHIHTDKDFEKLANEMKQPYYEKIDGRPLVYLFDGYRLDYIERLNKLCANNHLPAPFIVFLDNGVKSENGDYSKADAVSAYACSAKNITTHKQFCDILEKENEKRKQYGIDVIPLFSIGWNPRPRILNPVAQGLVYPDVDYAPYATVEELLDGARRFCKWIKNNESFIKSRHILTFAWNEFEEGGFICPTYNEDKTINYERIKTFKKISDLFKEEF